MLWHYTIVPKLPLIIESGELRGMEDSGPIGLQPGEKSVVWFSSNPEWEHTATKIVGVKTPDGIKYRSATMDEMYEIGMARISVEDSVAPHDWRSFTRNSGTSRSLIDGLHRSAIQMGGKPAEWMASFEPVPASKWKSIEVRERDTGWRVLTDDEIKQIMQTQ